MLPPHVQAPADPACVLLARRMLKYTPEHMHCLANIYCTHAPPNTGVLAVRSTAANQKVWRHYEYHYGHVSTVSAPSAFPSSNAASQLGLPCSRCASMT